MILGDRLKDCIGCGAYQMVGKHHLALAAGLGT